MPTIDETLASQIDAEFAAIMGGDVPKPECDPVPEAKPEPITLPDIEPPPEWPNHLMFSEKFEAEQWLKDNKLRDLPVPDFKPEDWPEPARALIPKLPSYWVHPLRTMYNIALSCLTGETTLATGPTGSGKTKAIEAFGAVCNIPVWQTGCSKTMEDTLYLGSTGLRADPETGANVTQYNPSQLYLSMKYGGIKLFDEVFRSPCNMAIQSVFEADHRLVLPDADGLSEEERVVYPPAGRWFCFLTDNTTGTGDHTGSYNAEVQDLSTLDRITHTFHVGYMPPEVEITIIKRAVPAVPENYAKLMVGVATEVRAAFDKGALLQTMSMRALISWAQKWAIYGNMRDSFVAAFYSKLDPESQGVTAEIYQQVTAEDL